MLIRILALVLLVSSCSGTASTNANSKGKEEQPELKFIFKSQADAALHLKKVLSDTPYPLSDEQALAIDNLAANYTVETLNDGKQARSALRKEIIEKVLLPQQKQSWLEYSRKKKRSVTIE